jgi:hypothetical protein
MKIHNPMCDGSHCRSATAPVRLYPTGGGGNMIYCEACFANENRYRFNRGRETRCPENFPQVAWATAKPYPEAE